jgi:O-Antigen ligase
MLLVSSVPGKRMFSPILIAATASVVIIMAASFSITDVGGGGDSWLLIFGFGPLGLLAALLLPPSLPLILTIVFLECPFALNTDQNRSAAYIAAGLMAWTALASIVSVSRPRETGSNPLLGKVWFFAVYGIVSALRGLWLGNPRDYVLGDLFQIEEFAIVFVLVTRLVIDERTSRRLMACALGSTFFTVVWQLAAYTTGRNGNPNLPIWEGGDLNGALPRTIDLNGLFVLVTLLTLYTAIKSLRQRSLILLLLIPTVANLLFSFTRGVWLASSLAVAVSVCLLHRAQRRELLKVIALAALCVTLLAGVWSIGSGATNASLLDAMQDRLSFGVTQVQEGFSGSVAVETRRFVEITTIAPQILSSPLLGKGLGGLYWIDALAFINAQDLGIIDFHYMHNLYLLVGFRLGLVGLVSFLWILYSYFRESIRGCGRMPAGLRKSLVAGVIAGVAGEAVLSMTSPTILNHPTSALIACVMALTFRFQDPGIDAATGECLAG